MENEGTGTFNEASIKRLKCFFDLEPFYGERTSMCPPTTTDEMEEHDKNNENVDDNDFTLSTGITQPYPTNESHFLNFDSGKHSDSMQIV